MDFLLVNQSGKVRKETLNGRAYLVAPVSMIVPGVLNGSEGPLLYPADEIAHEPTRWDGIPLVAPSHPVTEAGKPISAKAAGIADRYQVGEVRASRIRNSKLVAEGWFDVALTQKIAPTILRDLESGRPLELSTGLKTDRIPAEGVYNNKPYRAIARNYQPDHLAVLLHERGACSIADGCGVLVNKKAKDIQPDKACEILHDGTVHGEPLTDKQRKFMGAKCGKKKRKAVENSVRGGPGPKKFKFRSKGAKPSKKGKGGSNCGIGSEGFERDNQCGKASKKSNKEAPKGTVKADTKKDRSQDPAFKRLLSHKKSSKGKSMKPKAATPKKPRIRSEVRNCIGDRSYAEFHHELQEAFREKFPVVYGPEGVVSSSAYITDVFDGYLIYRLGEELYRLDYSFEGEDIKLGDTSAEVERRTTYEVVENAGSDCGTGAGGFKQGNSCAKGGAHAMSGGTYLTKSENQTFLKAHLPKGTKLGRGETKDSADVDVKMSGSKIREHLKKNGWEEVSHSSPSPAGIATTVLRSGFKEGGHFGVTMEILHGSGSTSNIVVKRHSLKPPTTNEDVSHVGSSISNQEGEPSMALKPEERAVLVNSISKGCDCYTPEILNKLGDEELTGLKAKVDAKLVENAKPITDQEWLDKAPPGIRTVVVNAMKREAEEKTQLIATITANKRNVFTAEVLNSKTNDELRGIAALAAPERENVSQPFNTPNYQGAAAPLVSGRQTLTANFRSEDVDDMSPPTLNYAEMAKLPQK